MAPTILIAYATKHDSTREVAEQIGAVLADEGMQVTVRRAADVADLGEHAAVVIGGALYMGRWHKDARRFLQTHRHALATIPTFVFAMGPVDLEEKSVDSARRQLDHALAKAPEVQPMSTAIFGGVVQPGDLHFPFSHMPEADARDPAAIRAWAREVAATLGAAAATAG